MASSITISPANAQDIPALCELLDMLFSQEAEFQADGAAQRRGLNEIIANPTVGRILVARSRTTVIGMVSLLFSISTALGGRVAWLEDMVIHPDWRNRDIGSALLSKALEQSRTEGLKRITLLTDGDNLAAQGFYRKHGFSASPMIPMRRLF